MSFKFPFYITVEQSSSPITPPDTYLFRVLPSNTANLQRIIDEMMKESASVSREVVELVLKNERMTMKRLLVSGWRINDELFDAMVQARGLTYNGVWDPQVNSLYVNFQQGKELREALMDVEVVVAGKRQKPFYISGCWDQATGRTDFVATAGRCFTLTGKNLKVMGAHPSVGITLTNEAGECIRIAEGCMVGNWPSKVRFIIPEDMPAGEYELRVTTQSSSGAYLLKAPRSVSHGLRIINRESQR